MAKLNILVFIKFHHPIRKHFRDFLQELNRQANVQIWGSGSWDMYYVNKLMNKRGFKPDFIFHYDFAYGNAMAPQIHGLKYSAIPKGVYYFDIHVQTRERIQFVKDNNIDLVFCPVKEFFYKTLPELKDKFRWLPFSNNPNIYKDWHRPKDVDFMLMGRTWKEWYPFRKKVVDRMSGLKNFVYHKHPFEAESKSDVYIGEKYAKEINRAKIFFTCGTRFNYPVRKYFEVPACNTLLMAKGNNDLPELGYINGENFIECNEENFYDLAMYYLKHDDERERIAKNGYIMTHKKHTDRVRVSQFLSMIEKTLNKR
ncbi:MAG: hypothetical protein HPY66_3300 [Firmicutes bacterium]|nr:hypothetical protein [Bacillota bacterium]MDI6705305.1 glycosyltransferase [Bacillota bacterium]